MSTCRRGEVDLRRRDVDGAAGDIEVGPGDVETSLGVFRIEARQNVSGLDLGVEVDVDPGDDAGDAGDHGIRRAQLHAARRADDADDRAGFNLGHPVGPRWPPFMEGGENHDQQQGGNQTGGDDVLAHDVRAIEVATRLWLRHATPPRVQNAARYSAVQRVRQAAHGALPSPQTCAMLIKTRTARPGRLPGVVIFGQAGDGSGSGGCKLHCFFAAISPT
ncbi:MAG: hypothetical protein U1E43_04655 [Rhodospirillales bacterium]